MTGPTRASVAGRAYLDLQNLGRREKRSTEELLDAVNQVAADEADGCAWWLYLAEDDVALLRPHLEHPEVWLMAGDAEIELTGNTFDDYLDNVDVRIRKRIRRDRMLFARAGYHRDTQPLAVAYQQAGILIANLERHHGNRADPLNIAELLRAQAEDIGSEAYAHLCRTEDGVAVGVGVSYTTAVQVVSRACGFDYSQLRRAAEYFELAYYAPIEQAYRIGATQLLLGIGTYETKIRRGARIRLRWALRSGAGSICQTATDVQKYNETRWRYLVEQEGLRPEAVLDRDRRGEYMAS